MTSVKKDKSIQAEKEKKPKLIRDSFTIPKNEYLAIDALKARAMTLGMAAKKSELLRAGLMALSKLTETQLKSALSAVPTLKTGRPSTQSNSSADKTPASNPAVSPTKVETAPVKRAATARKSTTSVKAASKVAAKTSATARKSTARGSAVS